MQRIRRSGVLSEREHEVLNLVRVGLTNEEIALRLDISVSGVKYHVSEILGKLGVDSRRDAAALVLETRRPRWMTALAVAGAGISVIAVASLALLAWGVLRTGDTGLEVPSNLTLEGAYTRISEGLARPGFVLHTTIEAGDPDEPRSVYKREMWIDALNEGLREAFYAGPEWAGDPTDGETLTILDGPFAYSDYDVNFQDIEEFCVAGSDGILARLLECAISPHGATRYEMWRVETNAGYKGRAAAAIVFEQQTEQPVGDIPSPGVTPSVTPLIFRIQNITRLYLDTEDYLPIAQVSEYWLDGELVTEFISEYTHEFIPTAAVQAGFFDPASLSVVASRQALRIQWLLETTNRDPLKICIQAVGLDAGKEEQVAGKISALLPALQAHLVWTQSGLGVAEPVIETGCAFEPSLLEQSAGPDLPSAQPADVPSRHRLFVLVAPPSERERAFDDPRFGVWKIRQSVQEATFGDVAGYEVTTVVHLVYPIELDDHFLKFWLMRGIGLVPVNSVVFE